MNAYTRNIRRFRFHQYTYTWTRDFIIESKLSAKFIEVLEIGNAINRTNRNWKFFHCMAVAYFYFSRSRFFFYSFVFVIASTIICAPSVWWWCVSGEYSKTTTATTTQVTIPRSVCYDWCNFLHSSALLSISLAYQMWTSMNNVITDLDKNWIYLFHAFILWYVQWSLFDAFQNSINKKKHSVGKLDAMNVSFYYLIDQYRWRFNRNISSIYAFPFCSEEKRFEYR